jgi:hypothetical protein
MAVEFLWNAAFWTTAAEFAPIVTTGTALAAATVALCAIQAQRDTAIRMQLQ